MINSKETYIYKNVQECQIRADVYRAPGNGRQPAILWIHGGALIFGDRSGLHPEQAERYLSAGYTIVSIDYRLAPEIKLPEIIEDLQDAYAWMRGTGADLCQINPDQIAVIGHSAGGYLTLMAGFCLTPRPSALVSFYGYGDIVGDWYSKPDPHYCKEPLVSRETAYQGVGGPVLTGISSSNERWLFYLYCRQNGLWPQEILGIDPEKEPEAFVPFCPIYNVTAEFPPTMFLHGDLDTDVPYQQSTQMADELNRFKVTNHLITMSGMGHAFDYTGPMQHPRVSQVFDTVIAFLAENIHGR